MALQTLNLTPLIKQAPAVLETITQGELALLLSLRSRLWQITEQVEAAEQSIRERLEGGAAVELGAHFVRLEDHWPRSVAWRW